MCTTGITHHGSREGHQPWEQGGDTNQGIRRRLLHTVSRETVTHLRAGGENSTHLRAGDCCTHLRAGDCCTHLRAGGRYTHLRAGRRYTHLRYTQGEVYPEVHTGRGIP